MTKAEKEFRRTFDEAFYRLSFGVQFNIMDLGKLQQFVFNRVTDGANMDDAMTAAIAGFKVYDAMMWVTQCARAVVMSDRDHRTMEQLRRALKSVGEAMAEPYEMWAINEG